MSKRDEVAKHLCRMTCQEMSDEACGQTGCGTNWTMYRNDADAILALLSDPDDRMVEAAARALWDSSPLAEASGQGWGDVSEEIRRANRAEAAIAIRAAMKAAGE